MTTALFSPSVTRNKLPILNVLRAQIDLLRDDKLSRPIRLLEVASGAGATTIIKIVKDLNINIIDLHTQLFLKHMSYRAHSTDFRNI